LAISYSVASLYGSEAPMDGAQFLLKRDKEKMARVGRREMAFVAVEEPNCVFYVQRSRRLR